MKTAILSSLFLLIPLSTALGAGGEGVGGGAACVDSNGQPSPLYYCGAYNEPATPAPSPLPSPLAIDGPSEQPVDLPALEQYIQNFAYLTSETKQNLIHAMTPSFTRKYFSTVAPPDLTAPIVARIKAEFQRATGLNPKNLTLYAVTDTNAHMDNYGEPVQITYLLPPFFALPTQEERMTALFHENLWVLEPNADYPTIIGQETAFEAVMQQPNDTARLLDLVTKIQGTDSYPGYMTLILRRDLESGALTGFVDKNDTFTSQQLFGPLVQCEGDPSQGINDECTTTYEDYLDSLARTYPKSLFLEMADQEAKKLFVAVPNEDDSPTDMGPEVIDSFAIPFALIAYLDGVSPLYSGPSSGGYLPQPDDSGIHAVGAAHVLWSLAAKNSSDYIVRTRPYGSLLYSSEMATHLTSNNVPITIDASVNGALNGPLSTHAVEGRTMACTAWVFCQ